MTRQPAPLDFDPDQFVASGRAKIRCVTCGRTGYGILHPAQGGHPTPWQKACIAGHPYSCTCGEVFSTPFARGAHFRAAARRGWTGHERNDLPEEHPAYGYCISCSIVHAVRSTDGLMRKHFAPDSAAYCPGSNQPPRPA